MKVAPHFSVGFAFQDPSVPGGTIENGYVEVGNFTWFAEAIDRP
jgi:hypothetical protein